MNPRVKNAAPDKYYTVKIIFYNGEEKLFNVKPYLEKGVFRELKNIQIFKTVRPVIGSIQWKNGQGFCQDTLYLQSKGIIR